MRWPEVGEGEPGTPRLDDSEERGRAVRNSPDESRRHGGRGGRGRSRSVALMEVLYYTAILAFTIMVTYYLDELLKHAARRKRLAGIATPPQ
jgi:hypothetical protein